MTHYNTYLKRPYEMSRGDRDREDDQENQQQHQQLVIIPIVAIKTEENFEKDVQGGDEQGGGVLALAMPQPSQSPLVTCRPEAPSGNSKKRLRTATVLEEVDKKFLLEQYVSERQKNVNLQLQNRVSQLERELREQERLSTEKDKIHLETLALAENHHRETVLAEVGRLLEAEFNCSICNEVFIEPAVLNCGHTYCSYCINRALQTDFLCPVCRTGYNFNPPAKNIEMRNFINKLFQMLPEDARANRDTVLEERAALPVPDATAGSNNGRNRTRRRRSRSVSPFDLFGMFNDEDAFRERRSRSRSVSTLSDSDDSDDDSAISFFDLRASPRSPSPETTSRPQTQRSRTRSRSPTAPRTRRGRRSPHDRIGYLGGMIPLPWRNPNHHYGASPTSTSARPSSSSASIRFIPNHEIERVERRSRQQVARRGRAISTGRSISGTVSGPGRRYGWGPPRRQIHSNSLTRGSGGGGETNNNNNNDTNNPSSSSGSNNNNNNNTVEGNDDGRDTVLRRRMAIAYNSYRSGSGRWGAFGGGPTRLSREPTTLRIPVLTPRIARRPLAISSNLDNFEDLFSRRDPNPASNRIPAMPLPSSAASATSSDTTTTTTVAALNPPTLQPLLNHDHSYTSPNSSTSSRIDALAARSRAEAFSSINSQQQGNNGENGNSSSSSSSSAALMSGIERLQEQTRRLYAATNSVASTNRRRAQGGGSGSSGAAESSNSFGRNN